jgi:L-Lysine epsilon oxidase N-terminal/L-lysine epsilon oxidase C-terminal domain
MANPVYKIHPSIGIARVGDSPAFYYGPESDGSLGTEVTNTGSEVVLTHFKDGAGKLKRQAARFRIFEYVNDQPTREITAAMATIDWTIQVANLKASYSGPDWGDLRNSTHTGADRDRLNIRPNAVTIRVVGSQVNPSGQQPMRGGFQLKTMNQRVQVELGTVWTSSSVGRLVVLGGSGKSASPLPTPTPLKDISNDDWYDDVADGPVDATITFPGGQPQKVTGAWVIVAPPDFAPQIDGLVTLYDIGRDIAVQKGWLKAPQKPNFYDDIYPIVISAARLAWVNDNGLWGALSKYVNSSGQLGNPGAAGQQERRTVYGQLISQNLNEVKYTTLQDTMLKQWLNGDFDIGTTKKSATLQLDHAALSRCVGLGFGPGIEAGNLMGEPGAYMEPFRLNRQPFSFGGKTITLGPGSVTSQMALPWQADFVACSGNWWPAQRPDQIRRVEGGPRLNWSDGADGSQQMVDNFGKLGFILSNSITPPHQYLEVERSLPRPPVVV